MMSGTVSPAAERNREPILQVLRNEFRHFNTVLEIGSGTGQHAVYFAAKMLWLNWQTSDLRDNHAGINAWIDASEGSNIGRPFELDVRQSGPPKTRYDAVFSANTQEALTNVMKHAGSVETEVSMDVTPSEATLSVRNEAPSQPRPASSPLGSGRGLVGVRERVAAYGGTLSNRPTESGGYLLEVALPLYRPNVT